VSPTAADLNRARIDAHIAETLAQTFGLLKPIERTDQFVGHNRYWLFICSGCNQQVRRLLADVKRAFRNHQHDGGAPPACQRCQNRRTARLRKQIRVERVRDPEPEKMGRRCGYCGDMPWQRKGVACKGCEKPYAPEAAPARSGSGIGSWRWL
jgi:hypothetical protein